MIQVYNVHVSVQCTSWSQVEFNVCKLLLEVEVDFQTYYVLYEERIGLCLVIKSTYKS